MPEEVVPYVIEGELVPPDTLDGCVSLWKKAEAVEGRCQEVKAMACFQCLSQGLWRERHKSFAEFCEKELGCSKPYGSKLAAAYEVWMHIKSPNGYFIEGQLRPLAVIKKSAGRNWRPMNEEEVKTLKQAVKNSRTASSKSRGKRSPEEFYKRFVSEALFPRYEEKPPPLALLGENEMPRHCSIDLDWEGSAKRVVRALKALDYYDDDFEKFLEAIKEGYYDRH